MRARSDSGAPERARVIYLTWVVGLFFLLFWLLWLGCAWVIVVVFCGGWVVVVFLAVLGLSLLILYLLK